MTDFVQQQFDADCAVATMAMFLGVSYETIARHCTGAEMVFSGLSWIEENRILHLFKTPCDVFDRRVMDWSKPAILSVPSLNEAEGVTHSIYWDGQRAWDPQQGRKGKAFYTNQMAQEVAVTGIQRIVSDNQQYGDIVGTFVIPKGTPDGTEFDIGQDHHSLCCYTVTGGLEPCDCPLSFDDRLKCTV